MVGGNVGGPARDEDYPEFELYKRWLQLTMVLPSVQFSISPWDYGDDMITEANKLNAIRQNYVVPVLTELLDKTKLGTLEFGFPITPLSGSVLSARFREFFYHRDKYYPHCIH